MAILYLFFFFNSSQVIVVILHYVDKKAWILTGKSLLKGHSDLSAFSYKSCLLKKVYKQDPI